MIPDTVGSRAGGRTALPLGSCVTWEAVRCEAVYGLPSSPMSRCEPSCSRPGALRGHQPWEGGPGSRERALRGPGKPGLEDSGSFRRGFIRI